MKLKEQGQGESHSHYRYLAKRARDLKQGNTVVIAGQRLCIENVVWSYQAEEGLIWACFEVIDLNTQHQFLRTFGLSEWALVDTFQSRECGCE